VIDAERPGDLTPVQREILVAIRSHMRDRGRPPSMREVLENVDLDSTGALSYQYGKLAAKGYLRREAGRPRTVEVRLPGEPAFPSEAGDLGTRLARLRESFLGRRVATVRSGKGS